ncbi:MAG: hypothetical protein ACE5E5_15520 [Phycisphaerae bacterium]
MNIKYAIGKIEKHIGPIKVTRHENYLQYRAMLPNGQAGIEFVALGRMEQARHLRVCTPGDECKDWSDCPGHWCRNLKQMIEFVKENYWPSDACKE